MIRQFIYSLLLRVSIPAFGVINFMMIVRLFIEDIVGIWVLYMTVVALIEVSKDGFIKNATVWLISKEAEENTESILASSLRINLYVTLCFILLILIVVTIFFILKIYELLGTLLLLYIFQLLLNILYNHFDYYLSSQVQFKHMMVAYFIKSFSLFLLLFFTYFYLEIQVPLELLVGYQAIGVILGLIFFRKRFALKITIRNYKKEYIREIIRFGRYVFATNASSMLFRSTDHYMLAGLIGSGSVAFYNVALRITNLVDLPSTAAAEVIFPVSVKSTNSKDLKSIYERTVGYILALAIPATILIFIISEPLVLFIAGQSYIASVPVLKVTLIYGLLLPFLKQFGTMMNAINKPRINFLLMFFVFLMNIFFNYIFIEKFGLLGAAYGTLITYLIGFVANQIILKIYLNVQTMNVLQNIVPAYIEIYKRTSHFIFK